MINDELLYYSEQHSSAESDILYKIHRETYIKMPFPRMLSGHLQGRFLSMISKLTAPKAILEIGTFTGYSAICLAEGLEKQGVIHTIEINPELEDLLNDNFTKAGITDRVKLYIGSALKIIPDLKEEFNLIFLDADKENYLEYYHLVFDKLKSGGLLLADNTLWGGKILSKAHSGDFETNSIQIFNDFVAKDNRVEKLLLPFRDGITMIRKL